MTKKILIMAGGTGGHVFPGLAVAEWLRNAGHEVEWLGTQHGLDTKLVPAANIILHRVTIRGLRGKGKLGLLSAPFKILRALWQSIKILRRVKPNVVLGMGGYVAGPGGVAAWLLRIPLIVHEQNAIPGTTNSLLTLFSTLNIEAFPNSLPKKCKPLWLGNPIRENICQLPAPAERLARQGAALRVLVFGGSQGAQAINQLIPSVMKALSPQHTIEVWHQSGLNNIEALTVVYQEANLAVKLEAFINDMAAAYAWADVVICRSGALSVSELANVGVASILIPFPFAVDDHQTANAQFLLKVKAAYLIQERELTAQKLVAILADLSNNRQQVLSMAENARTVAKPNATADVAMQCLQESK